MLLTTGQRLGYLAISPVMPPADRNALRETMFSTQMALGWFNHLAAGRAIAWSGGSEPGSELNQDAVKAMAEVGIDISEELPKPWTDEFTRLACHSSRSGPSERP